MIDYESNHNRYNCYAIFLNDIEVELISIVFDDRSSK